MKQKIVFFIAVCFFLALVDARVRRAKVKKNADLDKPQNQQPATGEYDDLDESEYAEYYEEYEEKRE